MSLKRKECESDEDKKGILIHVIIETHNDRYTSIQQFLKIMSEQVHINKVFNIELLNKNHININARNWTEVK